MCNGPAGSDRFAFRETAVLYRTDRIRRRSKTPEPMPFHSISSDRIPRSCWGCRSLSMAVVRRDQMWSSSRRAELRSWYCPACYSRHPDSSVGRKHNRLGHRHCSCRRSEPKYCVLVPRSSRMILYTLAVVAEGEAAGENSSPCSWSDIRDPRREFRPADNTSIEGQCSDFQSDASRPNDRTRCIRSHSHRSERWSPAGKAWWSHHNTVAAALLRKCSRFASFPRQIVRRSREHHRHIGTDSQSTAPSRFSRMRPMSRRRSPNRVRASWWSMSSSLCSRCDAAHRLLPAQDLDLVLVAGTNNYGRSDPQVLGSRRVPEPNASLRDQRHQTSLRRGNGLSTDYRSWSWWLAARAADSDE